jgi:hypothetical protein
VYYVPLYHYVKLAVLVWAFLPQTLVRACLACYYIVEAHRRSTC